MFSSRCYRGATARKRPPHSARVRSTGSLAGPTFMFLSGLRRGSIARPWEGQLFMKLTPRKDKPCEPIISTSECWAGLKLVQRVLTRIVDRETRRKRSSRRRANSSGASERSCKKASSCRTSRTLHLSKRSFCQGRCLPCAPANAPTHGLG